MSVEQLRRLDDEALGRALAGLDLRWPAPPDVTADVMASVRAVDRRPAFGIPRLGERSRRRTVLLIAAALLALAAAAGAAKFVFDLGAVSIERIEGRPTGLPDAIFPGEPTSETLEEATLALAAEPSFPDSLGSPDRLWVQQVDPSSGTSDLAAWVGSAWLPAERLPAIPGTSWGAVLLELRGDRTLITKEIGAEGGSEQVVVDGKSAAWLTGAHDLAIADAGELVHYRVTGNVLVWQRGEFTFRLETALPLDEALAIANSID